MKPLTTESPPKSLPLGLHWPKRGRSQHSGLPPWSLAPTKWPTWLATRWAQRNSERRAVRAFKQGMAPIVIGLVMATAWVLGRAQGHIATDWALWLLTLVVALLVWRTRLHLLWLLGAGALLGALGWV